MADAVRLPYWVQHADFASEQHEPVDVSDGVRAFTEHDWLEEIALFSALERSGKERCPPGIGFPHPQGSILHVCPKADGRAMVHYHVKTVRRFLGIPFARRAVLTKPDFHRTEVVELIELFYSERDPDLRARLAVQPPAAG